ncbi:hypothetical protein OKW23_000879 [Bacilli bacterium PM5-9]|nr:hypothetical protein [Bacilli bacterium PM5-9]
MSYTFNRTETNVESGEEYETRTMLYLMNLENIENQLDVFLIDSFNDITGVCTRANWEFIIDAQSKGKKSFYPSDIGKSLITLFLNHLSDISFSSYFLICKNVSDNYLKAVSLDEIPCYKFSDFKDDVIKKIKTALSKEYERIFTNNSFNSISEECLENFFTNTFIVVDVSNKENHIKNSLPISKIDLMDSDKLIKIFDEITDKRVSLKKINIEKKTIHHISECLDYKKVIERKTIESLIISRVVGYDIFKSDMDMNVPIYFSVYLDGLDMEERRDKILTVNSEVSKTYFDVNNPEVFFEFLNEVICIVENEKNVDKVYTILIKNKINIPKTLTELSVKYMISMILGGLYDN